MLETPIFGRFQGENRRLLFGPPPAYYGFVNVTVAVGTAMFLNGITRLVVAPSGSYLWWILVGSAVIGAGLLAHASMQSIRFDLRERRYHRRQGPGLLPKDTRGTIGNIDALVCIAEPNSRLMRGGVTYHLVLYWKANMEPLMVVQQDTRVLPSGQPLNAGAGPILGQGARYANALGLPFHDNSHFASPCPVSIWA